MLPVTKRSLMRAASSSPYAHNLEFWSSALHAAIHAFAKWTTAISLKPRLPLDAKMTRACAIGFRFNRHVQFRLGPMVGSEKGL